MKLFYCVLLLCLTCNFLYAQDTASVIDSKQFFIEETPIDATITTDFGTLLNNKNTADIKATFSLKLPDSSIIREDIIMKTRGHFRLENCFIPPLKLDFKKPGAPKLSSLKSLKLVNGCNTGSYNDQLLLKEFLVYKIYNLICEKSFRVRLVNLKLEDSRGKKKPMNLHSFFIEDLDALAKRNQCKKLDESIKIKTESTNRMHMTLVSIFEYMIGNTDWSVTVNHNIRLIRVKSDSVSRPYPVPYDFDYAGLVDASYAVPDEKLGTQSVRERVYRGYTRNISELNEIIEVFKTQKENIYSLIKNFGLLSPGNKKEMINYLNEFYNSIKSDNDLKEHFIDKARTE
ncbi:MAG: hypothetical protein WDO19_18690 [Bacteroidota bacterium]